MIKKRLRSALAVILGLILSFAVMNSESLTSYSASSEFTSEKYIIMTATSNLKVHSGPGAVFDVIGKVPKGNVVAVLNTDNSNWFYVFTTVGLGYVNSGNLVAPGNSVFGVSREKSVSESKPQNLPYALTASTEVLAKETFGAINAERKRKGLPQLIWNDTLAAAANKRAKEIASKFSHTRPDGSSYSSLYGGLDFNLAGENIGSGAALAPSGMVSLWLESSGHRALIDNSGFVFSAVGVYRAPDGNIYYVEEFFG